MAKATCPICGGRLMFGSSAAVALAVAIEAELATQPVERRRRSRAVRRASGMSPEPEGAGAATPRAAEGQRLTRHLHDHIHQIAHLRNTPPLADLRAEVEAWLQAGDS